MAYSKIFDEKRYASVASILRKMQDLEEGEVLRVNNLTPEDVTRVRWLLYDWLRHQALKGAFAINTFGSWIQIRRRKLAFEDIEVTRLPLSPLLEDVLKQVIAFDAEDEVITFLATYNGLSEGDRERVVEEWKRIME